jgi:hypothetical protein
MSGTSFIVGENYRKLQSESKGSANLHRLVPHENFRIFCCNDISNKRNVEVCTREFMAVVITLRKWTWIRLTLKKDSSAVEKQALIGTHKDNVEEEDQEGDGENYRAGKAWIDLCVDT